MKKLSILVPILLLFIGCVDSELIVPDENIGGGDVDGGDTPVEVTILKQYDYISPFDTYQYQYLSDGKLDMANYTIYNPDAPIRESSNFAYTEEVATQVNVIPGTYSGQIDIVYNDENQIVELNAGSTPENKMVITYDGNDISAVRTIDGEEELEITFTTDSYGYINGFSLTDTDGQVLELELNLTENTLNSATLLQDETEIQNVTFDYDNKINPLFSQTIDNYNLMLLINAFELDITDPTLLLNTYALYRSDHNLTSFTVTGTNDNLMPSSANITYEYTEDGYPTAGIITIEDQEPGTILYTYY